MSSKNHFDHIVLGVGSMGSAACYYLAKRGHRVLGLEQFDITHEKGSHGGESRIIRKAYFEHPDYIPLLERAYHLWRELEEQTDTQLYFKTGLLYGGPKNHSVLSGVKFAAKKYGIELHELVVESSEGNLFRVPSDYELLFEPDAGFLLPEKAIRTFTNQAKVYGAEIRANTKVQGWKLLDHAIQVDTTAGTFTCDRLLITVGAWSGKLLPMVEPHLKVTRQVLSWYKPAFPSAFELGKFPCWLFAEPDCPGVFYGFPSMKGVSSETSNEVKVAYHHAGIKTDPDHVDRHVEKDDLALVHEFIRRHLPGGIGEMSESKTCLYSYSPDEHFVIDHLPGYKAKVCVAWGFSGHGFKFAPVVGEILADLATTGQTALPIGFLNANRFEK